MKRTCKTKMAEITGDDTAHRRSRSGLNSDKRLVIRSAFCLKESYRLLQKIDMAGVVLMDRDVLIVAVLDSEVCTVLHSG